jgi:D-aspartate ligase
MALARTLQHAGLEVCFVTQDVNVACFSRAMRCVARWPGATHPDAGAALDAIADEHGLDGSLLIPSGDEDVFLVAREHARWSSRFEVLTSDWSQLKWACNKTLTYRRAVQLGIDVPRVYEPELLRNPERLQYPLVLKPAIRLASNPFTHAKAWRVDHWSQFADCHAAACRLVGAENVVVQELVPGPGINQLSYAGLWNHGAPVASFTACRLRQYPVEFGHSSTYVRTEHVVDVSEAAERFLRSIHHHGLAEVEFKRDPATGALKLLDVNPRPWSWLSLAAAAGVDFGQAIASMVSGRPVQAMPARDGVAWMSPVRDLAAIARGRAPFRSVLGYPADCGRARAFAAFALKDPLPAVVELPLTGMRMVERRWKERSHAT